MAVYTEVTDEALNRFLAGYDIGRATSLKGIAEGVENSNYLLHAEAGTFLLTLYEKRVAERDLPFFLGLMEHLESRGVNFRRPRAGGRGLSRRPLRAPAERRPLRRGRRGAGAHARGGRGFRAPPRQRAV